MAEPPLVVRSAPSPRRLLPISVITQSTADPAMLERVLASLTDFGQVVVTGGAGSAPVAEPKLAFDWVLRLGPGELVGSRLAGELSALFLLGLPALTAYSARVDYSGLGLAWRLRHLRPNDEHPGRRLLAHQTYLATDGTPTQPVGRLRGTIVSQGQVEAAPVQQRPTELDLNTPQIVNLPPSPSDQNAQH
jgi:hypothetical protein